MLYAREHGPKVKRPKELAYQIEALAPFWGSKTVAEIRGTACRTYVAQRGRVPAARRELETLRAAVRYYRKEYGLDVEPIFDMPPKSIPRERWLTRQEAAALLRAARREPKHRHLIRFILIGLYTGTRHRAILGLQWMPNTQGGWVDLKRGVMHRRAQGARETRKRQPPMKIPPRLLAHLKRWHRLDQGIRHVVHFEGRGIARIEKAFRTARRAAGLGPDVVPHVLRHTRATWLAQAGVPVWEAAGSLGMTAEQFEAAYGHHHPDFQDKAARAY